MTEEKKVHRNLTPLERRQRNRRAELRLRRKREGIVDELRMQARLRASANAVMRVEPTKAEKMLEWKAADLIEEAFGWKIIK